MASHHATACVTEINALASLNFNITTKINLVIKIVYAIYHHEQNVRRMSNWISLKCHKITSGIRVLTTGEAWNEQKVVPKHRNEAILDRGLRIMDADNTGHAHLCLQLNKAV